MTEVDMEMLKKSLKYAQEWDAAIESRGDSPLSDARVFLALAIKLIYEKIVGGHGEVWRPIKTRPLTEEEKQNAIEKHDIDPDDLEYPFAWHFDCELPKLKENEQSVDVLVTTDLGFVKVTNFFIDYLGCPCFEDMDEAGEFVAWMPLPERYEPEVQDD